MPEVEEQKPDSGFDPPPPPKLRVLGFAVVAISVAFVLFAIVARLVLHH